MEVDLFGDCCAYGVMDGHPSEWFKKGGFSLVPCGLS